MAFCSPITQPIGIPNPTCMSAVARTFLAGAREAASQSCLTASGSSVMACEAKMVASVTIRPDRFISSRKGSMRISFGAVSVIIFRSVKLYLLNYTRY